MTAGDASAQFHSLVEVELDHERARALGRLGRRLTSAITDCETARYGVMEAIRSSDPRSASRARSAYREAFANYERARTDFCIQREANRLFDQIWIDRFYPPPSPPADLPSQPNASHQ